MTVGKTSPYENFDTLSSSAENIREDIPVPDGLRKKSKFIFSDTSRGYLKSHGMLISAMPSLADKVTC